MQPPPLLRISGENTPQHYQTQLIQRFADQVRAEAPNRLKVEFRHSAALFRDRDVIDAMLRGQLEMAVPGSWQVDSYLPDVGVFLLPMFYGRSGGVVSRLLEGGLGDTLSREFARTLDLHVLGNWLDLGDTSIYSRTPIARYSDIRNLRIRVAGSAVNAARIRSLGGEPSIVAWPDLGQALAENRIDAFLSTNISVTSAMLWRYGISTMFEDRQYFSQYVPLISGRFWRGLSPDLQRILAHAWQKIAAEGRTAAAKAQAESRRALANAGIRIVVPPPADVAAIRTELMKTQPELVARFGIDQRLVDRVASALADAP